MPSSSSSAPTDSRCCRASRSVGARSAPWRPARATAASAWAATAVLPEPTSPCSSRSIGVGRARSSRMAVIAVAWSAVSSTGAADAPRERARRARSGSRRRPWSIERDCGAASRTRCRRRPTIPSWSASSSSKASRRRAASRASNDVRVVGLLDRAGDRHERFLAAMIAAGRYSGYALPARSSASRMADRSRTAVRPAVSR